MDMSRFDAQFKNDERGRRAYNPKILLKIILLIYSRGIVHSRKIERECKNNVTFMALSCWQEPDPNTIAAFVSKLKEEIKLLFRDVLLVYDQMKLLGGTEFSLDGIYVIRTSVTKGQLNAEQSVMAYKSLSQVE